VDYGRLTHRYTPRRSKHEQTDEHDHRVLDQTPATAEPVTKNTDQNLTYDNADHLKVGDCLLPDRLANCLKLPAGREPDLEQRSKVANREEHVTREL